MSERHDGLARLCEVSTEVGAVFGQVSPTVQARMRLLADRTETVADCARIAARAGELFRYYERQKPGARFTELEKRIVLIGSVFADIGKTGPSFADAASQRLIVDMFSVEGVRDDQQSVATFLEHSFPADAAERKDRFAALGLDPGMSIRAFWNLHTGWTLDILRDAGLPSETIAAAATHHLLDDINPQSIVDVDGRFSAGFGDNDRFDRAEKLVILLDKYDALIRRGGLDHERAIRWLAERLARHPKFSADSEFSTLLHDMDVALREGAREAQNDDRG
jgi:hypothetical protein